jgi:hypothetical protein
MAGMTPMKTKVDGEDGEAAGSDEPNTTGETDEGPRRANSLLLVWPPACDCSRTSTDSPGVGRVNLKDVKTVKACRVAIRRD